MESGLLDKLGSGSITKEELLRRLELEPELLPEVLSGIASPVAAIRYGCGKVLMDYSRSRPELLYPHMDAFTRLLKGKYRILTWNAMAVIANLTRVDDDQKFDAIFDAYYGLMNDGYMVTVGNLIGNSATIASAKPYLVQRIAAELLKVERIPLTPHMTDECKRVAAGQAIKVFDTFFDKVEAKSEAIAFVRRQLDSPRASLRRDAERFLEKWD